MGQRGALVILVLAVHLPFLLQPFHVDDRVYLEIARNALEKPAFPYDYSPIFEGILTPDAASHSHLPLLSYYLAGIKWLTGSETEWILHLAFLIFPLLLALSFYGIATRSVRRPLLATLLLMLSPGVLVLGHTLMTEVPLLAFWTLAIDRAWNILDGSERRRDQVLLGLALICAAMMTILSLGLVLLVASMCLCWGSPGTSSRDHRRRVLLLLAIPVLVWVLWYLRGYLHYDRFLLVRTVQHLDKRSSFSLSLLCSKGISFLLCVGGALVFPLAALAGGWKSWTGWLALASGAAGFVVQFFLGGWGVQEAVIFALLLAAGVRLFAGSVELFARPGWAAGVGQNSRGLRALFLFWLLGIFSAAVLVYPSGSVRYVLLAFPPLIVGVCRLWEETRWGSIGWMTASLVLTAGLALALSVADYTMARLYKQQAHDLVAQYGTGGRSVWFASEWGFRYYLEKEGARILATTQLGPQVGDILIKPYVAFPWRTLYDGPEYLLLLEQRPAGPSPWLRLMDFGSRAGFYSTNWGMLPYNLSREPRWEHFNIYQVIKLYDGPIPEQEKHY